MLRNSASRLLSTSRRGWHLSHSTNFSRQSNGCLYHFWSHAHPVFINNNRKQERHLPDDAIPQISLTNNYSFSSLSRRYSSTSTTNESTFRERMEAQRDRGREAASKGAHSLKGMVEKYGTVFLGTYFTVYFSTLALLFAGIESGVLDPAYVMSWVSEESDSKTTVQVVTEFMDHYAWTRPYVPIIENNPEVANLGVAWIAVKFTEPIRFGTTVAIVPRLSRYLGYAPEKDAPETVATTEETKEEQSTTESSTSTNSEEIKSSKS